MSYDFRLPKIEEGSDRQQLEQIKKYLAETGEMLTFVLNSLDGGSGGASASLESIKESLMASNELLNFLYIQINRRLSGKYASSSDFKEFQESVEGDVKTLTQDIEGMKTALAGVRYTEYDTPFGWRVRKYEDGTAELWREYKKSNCLCTVAWGSLYRAPEAVPSLSFPISFDGVPYITVTAHGVVSPYFIAADGAPTATGTGSYSAVSAEKNESLSVHLTFHVRGTLLSTEEETI